MRVVWLTARNPWSPSAGGAERTVREVGSRLARRGHDVVILTEASRGGSSPQASGSLAVSLYNHQVWSHAVGSAQFVRRIEPDVVIDDLAHIVPWSRFPQKSPARVAFFRHLHSRTLAGQTSLPAALPLLLAERLYPLFYPRSTFVTESSSSERDLQSLGIRKSRIRQIAPGVDAESYRPAVKTPYPSLVYFAGLKGYKRPTEIIPVFRQLRRKLPNATLTVVGDGPLRDSLMRLAKEHDVAGQVRFTGRVADNELAIIVSESWVNLHFSVSEGWGYSTLEAAACGTPTVGYHAPGVDDAVDTGNSGILVRSGDRDAVVNSVVLITQRPARWSRTARQWALRFDWERCASEWEDTLRHAKHSPGDA